MPETLHESTPLLETPLAGEHLRLGARMAPFAGWDMPLQYEGMIAEHQAVRQGLGVFDISHMGQLMVNGAGAGEWLNGLLSNDLSGLAVGQGQYSLMLNPQGGIIDDLILYRLGVSEWLLIVNASRKTTDFAWLEGHLPEDGSIRLDDVTSGRAGLAIQGPGLVSAWERIAPGVALPERNGIIQGTRGSTEILVCRTGYTGEDGCEVFCPSEGAEDLLRAVLAAGASPCGLGARDTLRLEKGYALYGSDLDARHTPLEAGLGAFVKLGKSAFVGQARLLAQKAEGVPTKLVALQCDSKGPPPRAHSSVYVPGSEEPIGELTSGGFSPSLGIGIGLAYLPIEFSALETSLEVGIRDRRLPVTVVRKPFY